jgi:hypothetical protein
MIYLFFLIPIFSWAQDFSESSFTMGARSSYFKELGGIDNTFLYYVPEYADEDIGETITQRRKFKLRVFDYVNSDERVIIDPLDISYEVLTNHNSFQIGFLRYRFSETFGVQLLDVANPRDYSEFIFNDLAWSKRAVFGLNNTYRLDKLQIQLILTLWPNGDRLPYRETAFDPTNGRFNYRGGVIHRPWFEDLEYGSRFKYLFENGVDLSFLYYHHFTRPTFFDMQLRNFTDVSLTPTDHMVDSFGSSLSYVWQDWVLRADFLYTKSNYVQLDLLSYRKEDHFQSLIGIDNNFENFLLGLQTQSDFTINRHFYGARFEWTAIDWWKPSLMVFKNVKGHDEWVQLRSMFERSDWRLVISYDYIHGGRNESDLFGHFRQNDRLLVDLGFTY